MKLGLEKNQDQVFIKGALKFNFFAISCEIMDKQADIFPGKGGFR